MTAALSDISATPLNARALINVGVFSALYFIAVFATAMLGILGPGVQIVGFFLGTIINATIIMLYMVKTPAMGAMTVLGAIIGLLMILTGHYILTLLITAGLGLVADLIVKAGKYRSRGSNILAYTIFQFWVIGPLLPIFFAADAYFKETAASMGQVYADGMRALFSPTYILVFLIGNAIIAAISGWIGTRILERHFTRAGLL
ncbi:MAG: MptD family putative ECF transporter S component [Actinomycetaceae bacterium]|nr:MptD family putative ECF transporter S component [Actinomycetaceae bacterium]